MNLREKLNKKRVSKKSSESAVKENFHKNTFKFNQKQVAENTNYKLVFRPIFFALKESEDLERYVHVQSWRKEKNGEKSKLQSYKPLISSRSSINSDISKKECKIFKQFLDVNKRYQENKDDYKSKLDFDLIRPGQKWYMLIYIIDDPINPENNNKFFNFEVNKFFIDKIDAISDELSLIRYNEMIEYLEDKYGDDESGVFNDKYLNEWNKDKTEKVIDEKFIEDVTKFLSNYNVSDSDVVIEDLIEDIGRQGDLFSPLNGRVLETSAFINPTKDKTKKWTNYWDNVKLVDLTRSEKKNLVSHLKYVDSDGNSTLINDVDTLFDFIENTVNPIAEDYVRKYLYEGNVPTAEDIDNFMKDVYKISEGRIDFGRDYSSEKKYKKTSVNDIDVSVDSDIVDTKDSVTNIPNMDDGIDENMLDDTTNVTVTDDDVEGIDDLINGLDIDDDDNF